MYGYLTLAATTAAAQGGPDPGVGEVVPKGLDDDELGVEGLFEELDGSGDL